MNAAQRDATTWLNLAACRGTNPDIFFPLTPPDGRRRSQDVYAEARSYCDRCEVRQACLDDVMATESPNWRSGMYGGTSPRERDRLWGRR